MYSRPPKRKCLICGNEFQPNNAVHRICSHACNVEAVKLRRAGKSYPYETREEQTNLAMQRKDAAIRMLIFQLCRSISCGACSLNPHCKSKGKDHSECYCMWAEETKDFMQRVNLTAQPDCVELGFIKDVLEA